MVMLDSQCQMKAVSGPLAKKFGVELDMAFDLIKRAAKNKIIRTTGITFHVGSQCLNPYNWYIAIDKAKKII